MDGGVTSPARSCQRRLPGLTIQGTGLTEPAGHEFTQFPEHSHLAEDITAPESEGND